MKPGYFRSASGHIPLPVFFPDATRAVVKSLDSSDIESTKTPGVLVNTYHLYQELGKKALKSHGGVGTFMGWRGGLISDSGGFQVMSVIKSGVARGKVTDEGVVIRPSNKRKLVFTPEKSIQYQMLLKTDLMVVLDDYTPPHAEYKEARETVERTVAWAKRSKIEFDKLCRRYELDDQARPYLVAVAQGGKHLDLRRECTERLVEIGFDGMGLGGRPHTDEGELDVDIARTIARYTPEKYLLYGLGVGLPPAIIGCFDLGYRVFDCVLPTRDARHKRLYVFNADSIKDIDLHRPDFFSFYSPMREKHYADDAPVSRACDCELCTRYSRAYLNHLFKIGDFTAGRLASIHNLRFYSLLMEKLRHESRRTGKGD